MAITLNHTIVPARDRKASATFFAHIFGIPDVVESGGRFTQVRVNGELTMDFDETDAVAQSHHYAFKVSEADFDGIYSRIQAAGIAYGSGPFERKNMQINPDRRGGRSVYWEDLDGHLLEIMTK